MHLFERHTIPAVGFIGLASLAIHLIVPEAVSHALATTLLSMIAGVYLGFAVQDGRIRQIYIEGSVAVGFVGFAVWALVNNPVWLPLGYIAHAFWDWAHHAPYSQLSIPRWYIPACVVYDLLVGVGLWIIWLT